MKSFLMQEILFFLKFSVRGIKAGVSPGRQAGTPAMTYTLPA